MPTANVSLSPAIRPYWVDGGDAVVARKDRCGLFRAWNDPRKDIARKLAVAPDLFLVADIDRQPVGTVMAGFGRHRG